MLKMIVLYKQPHDVDAFVRHYEQVHLPIARKIPGVGQIVVNRITANAMGGDTEYFQITELHFANRDVFRTAMKSEQNKAAGEDLMKFAKGLATVLIADASVVGHGEPA